MDPARLGLPSETRQQVLQDHAFLRISSFHGSVPEEYSGVYADKYLCILYELFMRDMS